MAIKRIIARYSKKHRKCLKCGQHIDGVLRDNEVYTCERCGQQHLIDVYKHYIAMTIAERPEVRHRTEIIETPQSKARQALIKKVEERKEQEAWEGKYREWLEELAEMPEQEREAEFNLMDDELLRRVKVYFEKRNEP